MEEMAIVAMSITVLSAVLRFFPKLTIPKRSKSSTLSSGAKFLIWFLLVVLAFGCYSAYRYWPQISRDTDLYMLALGLLLTMAAGMFVQVLGTNHRAGRPLFDVTASQLIFPLLFALIVFYPIWVLTSSSATGGLFPFYAAFLNGYFWESVVSTAKSPGSTAVAAAANETA